MTASISTQKLELAARFVNSTNNHIFLTGKAGTGKTTFLHDLARSTHKNYLIVAPTGIAALNAKGVTIHSQFQLPFGSFLCEPVDGIESASFQFYTRRQLTVRHGLNSARKRLLRNIDLLIIDEVSMLRADLLDAIDHRLKSVKGNFQQPFGGVQLLMIGDLFQLPPIIKDHEWRLLKQLYNGPHFFESRALKQSGFTYLELDKIFRQQDEVFIDILNALRNDRCTEQHLKTLNSYLQPAAKAEEGVVTLTTHNYQADQQNRQKLNELEGPSHYFQAKVDGEFPENLFPLPESLELRIGAQVMFIKNDNESGAYYNGKLAKVIKLDEDGMCVSMDDIGEYWISQYKWENVKYVVNEVTNEQEEQIVGSFTQFPLKLAWAITVHKSQGLTFDKAIIDVGRAFAPGQVYVALSRLRSLNGLILKTPVSPEVISSDAQVVEFSSTRAKEEKLEERLLEDQLRYIEALVRQTFDIGLIQNQIKYVLEKLKVKMEFEDAEMEQAVGDLYNSFEAERGNTGRFQNQLVSLLREGKRDVLKERIAKGCDYYLPFLREQNRKLLIHKVEVEQLKKTKTYVTALTEIDQLISLSIRQVKRVSRVCDDILSGKDPRKDEAELQAINADRQRLIEEVESYVRKNPKNITSKSGRKSKKKNPPGHTYQVTYDMLGEGLSAEEIAKARGLVIGTIQSHIVRGISEGVLMLDDHMPQDVQEKLISMIQDQKEDANLTEIHSSLNREYSYPELRMVQAHLRLQKMQKPQKEKVD